MMKSERLLCAVDEVAKQIEDLVIGATRRLASSRRGFVQRLERETSHTAERPARHLRVGPK